MAFSERVVIIGCSTEIIPYHFIISLLINTALRENGYRQGIRIVRIGVEERIFITNGSIAHSAVSLCLVRVVCDEVFLRGCLIFDGSQCA